jgi:hypothetical protein
VDGLIQPGDTLRMERAGAPLATEKRIGEGGQGVVHVARLNGTPFAVKWFRPGLGSDEMGQRGDLVGDLAYGNWSRRGNGWVVARRKVETPAVVNEFLYGERSSVAARCRASAAGAVFPVRS